jgi:large subunit ribosomal protein L6
MSKIWKKPIIIPAGVEVTVENNNVKVKWPKWELSEKILDCVKIEKWENEITLSISDEEDKKFRGLSRTLIANMIEWVTNWYEKKLLIIWVWYGWQVQWRTLVLSLWYAHKVNYQIPAWIEMKTEQDPKWNTIIILNSINKQLIWEVAAKIRAYKKPEPYKGKWIRYFDEFIKLKPGKSAK